MEGSKMDHPLQHPLPNLLIDGRGRQILPELRDHLMLGRVFEGPRFCLSVVGAPMVEVVSEAVLEGPERQTPPGPGHLKISSGAHKRALQHVSSRDAQ